MDDNVETSRSCKKKQRACEERVEDRISSLPDSVLIHILSFLPTEDAVRTVLVPRFRHLWQFLTTLTFDHRKYFGDPTDDGPFFNEKFLDFVHHVLICHQNATIDKFVLKLHFNFYFTYFSAFRYNQDFANREKRMASEIDSWVYFAMRKKVKVLHLDFHEGWEDDWISEPDINSSYRLPNVVLRSKYLLELNLVFCEIKPSGQIQLNCLKRLFLEEIVLNDEILNQILGGCSVLEELSLIRCFALGRLGFRNSSIKSLTLFHDPYYEQRVEISCPNIESLDIDGDLDLIDVVDVPSVVVCSINSSGVYNIVNTVFKNLGHCKAFRPCDSCILVFSEWQLRNQPGLQFGWKCLEFEVGLTKWHLPGISCLLRSSPYLETLAMSIHPRNDETCQLGQWRKCYDFDGRNFWRSQEGTLHCLKYHLKTIKISDHVRGPYVIDIIEYLLKNAMVLEKFEISTQKCFRHPCQAYGSKCALLPRVANVTITTKRRLEFSQKLLSLPRASPHAVIIFS